MSRLARGIPPAEAAICDLEMQPAIVVKPSKRVAGAHRLTLDDFGGRSDALGG